VSGRVVHDSLADVGAVELAYLRQEEGPPLLLVLLSLRLQPLRMLGEPLDGAHPGQLALESVDRGARLFPLGSVALRGRTVTRLGLARLRRQSLDPRPLEQHPQNP
jgi:hypothetical protein